MSDFETNVGRIVRYMIEINGITDSTEAIKVLDEAKFRIKEKFKI